MRYVKLLPLSVIVGVLLLAFSPTATAAFPLTSPAGTDYSSTIKAEDEGPISLHGAFVPVSCEESTIEGKVESHSASKASGKISSLTFGKCNYPVKVLKPGSLDLHVNPNGTNTLISSGAEITIDTSLGSCLYTTSSTDLGTLKDSTLTEGNATLTIGSASIPRTGHSFFCGASGVLTGSYKVTTPSALYLDSPSPLTSPAGTYYTGAIKAGSEGVLLHVSFGSIIECEEATVEGKVESHSSGSVRGNASALAFGKCNAPVTVLNPGFLELHVSGKGSGTLTSDAAEVTIGLPWLGISCLYTTNNTHIGNLTDSTLTGGNAKLDIVQASIPRTGHSPFCGGSGVLTGSYKVTTPSTLYLD